MTIIWYADCIVTCNQIHCSSYSAKYTDVCIHLDGWIFLRFKMSEYFSASCCCQV